MKSNNPMGWPGDMLPVLERFVTCEWATLTKAGAPITWPVTPYMGEDGRTLDASTGLTYPAKADRARRNPKVALLYSNALGSGLSSPPVVLVQGLATVRDRDLQAGSDRYIRLSMAKSPAAFKGQPKFLLHKQAWYFTRIWVLITPLRILWWSDGRLDEPPQQWDAPQATTASASDPAPSGPNPGAWQQYPAEWQARAKQAVTMGRPVLTVVGSDGFPVPFRMHSSTLSEHGFDLRLPSGMPAPANGPACLTFHTHAEVFTGQENAVFVGQVNTVGEQAHFRVERLMPDFSLSGNKLKVTATFLGAARRLNPRLKQEAARRGQSVPSVRLPDEQRAIG